MQRVLGITALFVFSGLAYADGHLVTATDTGVVAVFDKTKLMQPILTFRPYRVAGGVFVAAGDVTGDGVEDVVTAPSAGAGAVVRVFDQVGQLTHSFLPYDPTFTGGVRVAVGDVTGDGVAEIITGAGPGVGATGGHVRVFTGTTPVFSFFAFPGFSGGVTVAAGDINGDGRADIIVGAGPGAPGGHVKVFDGVTGQLHASFFAYDTAFTGGVRVASGDVNGDGRVDIIVGAGAGGGPHVKVFSGHDLSLLRSFLAFDPSYTGGVHVTGPPVVVTPDSPSGGIATIRIFYMDGQVQWLMPFPDYKGGLTIGSSDGAMGKAPSRPKIPGLK